MSFLALFAFAIMIACCIFGLNQIILMSSDVKYIKAVMKDMAANDQTVSKNNDDKTE